VPVLKDGDLTVWDSLAICEYLAERFPQAALWPADPANRALARAAAAEMHSGFGALRRTCPMDIGARAEVALDEEVARDIRRIVELWTGLLTRSGGPFLLGDWSIADAFFTPVATRFETYGVDLASYGDEGGAAEAYWRLLLAQPEYEQWADAAVAE
jgi:glutathione S-transferase